MIDIEKVRRELNNLDADIKAAFCQYIVNYDRRIIDSALSELSRLQGIEQQLLYDINLLKPKLSELEQSLTPSVDQEEAMEAFEDIFNIPSDIGEVGRKISDDYWGSFEKLRQYILQPKRIIEQEVIKKYQKEAYKIANSNVLNSALGHHNYILLSQILKEIEAGEKE